MKSTALLLLLSCTRPCKASSGLEWVGFLQSPVPSWSCETFRYAHDRAIRSFEAVKDSRFQHVTLEGFRVQVYSQFSFSSILTGGTLVGGMADCHNGFLTVNNESPSTGPFAHEMAHAIQRCNAQAEMGEWDSDTYHAGWYERGIWQALELAKEPE